MLAAFVAAPAPIMVAGSSPGHTATPYMASSASDAKSVENTSGAKVLSADGAPTAYPRDPVLVQPIMNDPYLDKQWALRQIRASEIWRVTKGQSKVIVAILDTGIDASHEDLDGKVIAQVSFADSPTIGDVYGHGTSVAGIIAAKSNNNIGIAGLAPDCRLYSVKVADDSGRARTPAVVEGIIWAADHGAQVINISIQLKDPTPDLEAAVDYAWSKGAVIVAASGNNGNSRPVFPAYYDKSIAVAATGQGDELAPLSNRGPWVDVGAPGFNIYSTSPGGRYGYESGTSFASAYVSGLAALLFAVSTDRNGDGRLNDEVRHAIEAGCQKIDAPGVGNGRIDAASSLSKTR